MEWIPIIKKIQEPTKQAPVANVVPKTPEVKAEEKKVGPGVQNTATTPSNKQS